MRIKELVLKDYQVIKNVKIENLSDFNVIAGPNGVGKTKIKDAICYIFQNNGNPPPNCSVILESTNDKEKLNWGTDNIKLPHNVFWSIFSKPRKKIKTTARLIQIDSGRQIDAIQFQQLNFSQIGNPDEEEVGNEYSMNTVKNRFIDICNTLQREKIKLLTDLGKSAYSQLNANLTSTIASVQRIIDPTKAFEDLFYSLLYPKKMIPIEPDSSTLQYLDEDNVSRPFSSLSSGEREVIVLAFDILMQHPSDCIILIDEPEIHLHPELTYRLIKVLKHIGERNQFFLFTHSTDIISNSFETGIHFIRPKSVTGNNNQTLRIDMNNLADLMNLPNLREAIGMLSLGKKLLFVEGSNNSIDRNVFATIAKSSKNDLAIVPSESCDNINNLSSIADTLHKGIFGIDLYMVRDRDSLTDEEVKIYTEKSKNKLIFLPYYHIENTFLFPEAIFSISQNNTYAQKKSLDEIKNKLVELARNQLNESTIRYVANEIRFKAGNLDITPILNHNTTTKDEIIKEMSKTKQEKLQNYSTVFSDEFIKQRVEFWNTKLQDSIKNGWTEDARNLFYGKSILNQIQQWIFPGKHVVLWEQIINSNDVNCVNAVTTLKAIIDSF